MDNQSYGYPPADQQWRAPIQDAGKFKNTKVMLIDITFVV